MTTHPRRRWAIMVLMLSFCDESRLVRTLLTAPLNHSLHIEAITLPEEVEGMPNHSNARSVTTSTSRNSEEPSPRKVERTLWYRLANKSLYLVQLALIDWCLECLLFVGGQSIALSSCQRVDTTSIAVGAQA
jgi:hypothetical protein